MIYPYRIKINRPEQVENMYYGMLALLFVVVFWFLPILYLYSEIDIRDVHIKLLEKQIVQNDKDFAKVAVRANDCEADLALIGYIKR